MIDPIGTMSLKGQCYSIEIFGREPEMQSATIQFRDEHATTWRICVGKVEKLLEKDYEYFIKLMTTETMTVRIKILDSMCDTIYPRSYDCDSLQYE